MNNIKKESNEIIKKYSNKEQLKDYIKKEFLTDDEDAHIYLVIEDRHDLFDKRTVEGQLDIKNDIYSYIDNKAAVLDNSTKLHFHIKGLITSEEDEENVKKIIREHYAIELYKSQREYKLNKYKMVTLILLGIIMLSIYAIVYIWTKSAFLLEVFGFLFSFALWQAFEIFMYNLSDIRFNSESIAQKLLMNIDFEL